MELSLQDRFEVVFENDAYCFVSPSNIQYQIIFVDYTNVIDACTPVYMLTIERYIPQGGGKKYDFRVQYTILHIIRKFFSVNENAMISIYDIGDGRQAGRKRLFDRWFCRHNTNLIKMEKVVEINNRETTATLLYSSTNQCHTKLISGFNQIVENNFYCN